MNFSISAYCGRCERPLPRGSGATASVVLGAVGADRATDAVPGAASPRPDSRLAAPPGGSPATTSGATPASRGAHVGPAAATPLHSTAAHVAVPAPLPPLALEAAPPPASPIELDGRSPRRRPPGPDLGDLPADPDADVPVALPSELRLFIARGIDALLGALVGALVFFLEALVRGASFQAVSRGSLDRAAEWLNIHGDIAVHGMIVATLAAGVHSVTAALRSGQTVGRKLTNTVLVRRSGRPHTAALVAWRTIVGLLSAACFGAGFLWAVIDRSHRGWHDLAAGTVTVRRYVRVHDPGSGGSARP